MNEVGHRRLHDDPRLQTEEKVKPQVIIISDDESEDERAGTLSQEVFGDPLEEIEAFIGGINHCDSTSVSRVSPIAIAGGCSLQDSTSSFSSPSSPIRVDHTCSTPITIDHFGPPSSSSSSPLSLDHICSSRATIDRFGLLPSSLLKPLPVSPLSPLPKANTYTVSDGVASSVCRRMDEETVANDVPFC